jgi:hypothetical protein
MKAQRYSSTFSLTSTLDGDGWSTQRPGRFTTGKVARFQLSSRLGGPQGRSGRVRKISPLRPNGIRSPDRPARSKSLLRYPGPPFAVTYRPINARCVSETSFQYFKKSNPRYDNKKGLLLSMKELPALQGSCVVHLIV